MQRWQAQLRRSAYLSVSLYNMCLDSTFLRSFYTASLMDTKHSRKMQLSRSTE